MTDKIQNTPILYGLERAMLPVHNIIFRKAFGKKFDDLLRVGRKSTCPTMGIETCRYKETEHQSADVMMGLQYGYNQEGGLGDGNLDWIVCTAETENWSARLFFDMNLHKFDCRMSGDEEAILLWLNAYDPNMNLPIQHDQNGYHDVLAQWRLRELHRFLTGETDRWISVRYCKQTKRREEHLVYQAYIDEAEEVFSVYVDTKKEPFETGATFKHTFLLHQNWIIYITEDVHNQTCKTDKAVFRHSDDAARFRIRVGDGSEQSM